MGQDGGKHQATTRGAVGPGQLLQDGRHPAGVFVAFVEFAHALEVAGAWEAGDASLEIVKNGPLFPTLGDRMGRPALQAYFSMEEIAQRRAEHGLHLCPLWGGEAGIHWVRPADVTSCSAARAWTA